jgi:hypothetical protein
VALAAVVVDRKNENGLSSLVPTGFLLPAAGNVLLLLLVVADVDIGFLVAADVDGSLVRVLAVDAFGLLLLLLLLLLLVAALVVAVGVVVESKIENESGALRCPTTLSFFNNGNENGLSSLLALPDNPITMSSSSSSPVELVGRFGNTEAETEADGALARDDVVDDIDFLDDSSTENRSSISFDTAVALGFLTLDDDDDDDDDDDGSGLEVCFFLRASTSAAMSVVFFFLDAPLIHDDHDSSLSSI